MPHHTDELIPTRASLINRLKNHVYLIKHRVTEMIRAEVKRLERQMT